MKKLILELTHSIPLADFAFATGLGSRSNAVFSSDVLPNIESFNLDRNFGSVPLPAVSRSGNQAATANPFATNLEFDASPQNSTYLVRGEVADNDLERFSSQVNENPNVTGVFADGAIQAQAVCPGSRPVGNDSTVESLLSIGKMRRNNLDGRGVLVAIVDSGVNMAYLNSREKNPNFDAARSWSWDADEVTPGSAPVDHGTMCAFDVCIAAPRCTLLDIALLRPINAPPGGSLMEALLSDAIVAYRHLLDVMNAPRRPGDSRSLVVNNSWGMFNTGWDFPPEDPRNYSDNPNHPFNRIVGTLERAGADILFAAGNCGEICPDSRCGNQTNLGIFGANSSSVVLSVAGVDITKTRVGYSTAGPGRLQERKPDISGYTHFMGSGVYAADGGTSAACPVVAGVVAAIRSNRPYNSDDADTSPAAIRSLVTSTAEDLGPTGYDYKHGYGVVDGSALVDKLISVPPEEFDLCQRFPWICDRNWWRRILELSPSSVESALTSDSLAKELSMKPEEALHLINTIFPEIAKGEISTEYLAFKMGQIMQRKN